VASEGLLGAVNRHPDHKGGTWEEGEQLASFFPTDSLLIVPSVDKFEVTDRSMRWTKTTEQPFAKEVSMYALPPVFRCHPFCFAGR
jgi:hypothetical protein